MTSFVIAATFVLSLASCVALLLRGRDRETQRLILLAGMATTLLLPFAARVTSLTGALYSDPAHSLGAASAVWESSAPGTIFLVVWLAGASLMTARLCWHAFLALRLSCRSCALVATESAAVSQTLTLEMCEVARRFRIAEGIDTPLVLAGVHQTVLLPAAWSRWPAALQASALRHEWQHVRAADAQWAVLVALLRTVLWFHPLAWWVSARWAEQCEILADTAAVSGRARAEYAQELLSLAIAMRPDGLVFATAFTPRTRSRLERRVRAVLDDSSSSLPCGRMLRLLLPLMFATTGVSLAVILAPQRENAKSALKAEAQIRLIANPFPADP